MKNFIISGMRSNVFTVKVQAKNETEAREIYEKSVDELNIEDVVINWGKWHDEEVTINPEIEIDGFTGATPRLNNAELNRILDEVYGD